MKVLHAMLLVALAASGGAAQDEQKKEEKTYDFTKGWVAVEGAVLDVSETKSMDMTAVVELDGAVVQKMADKTGDGHEATRTLLKVIRGHVLKEKWEFRKAYRLVEGEEKPYVFADRTVLVEITEKGEWKYRYKDGTDVGAEELPALKEIVGKRGEGAEGEEEEMGGAEAYRSFSPPKPLKVGESWTPDVSKMIEELFSGPGMVGIDKKASKGKFTLASVEERDGAEFGRLEGEIELHMTSMGLLKLKPPLVMKFTVEGDACLDGKKPDSDVLVNVVLKGETKPDMPNSPSGLVVKMDIKGRVGAVTKSVARKEY
ncbi:MAG: hypothetical protein ACYTAF_02570 [Planctomycetota bacterium]|jgi:hypothetical protein